ncbi:MerR family transcriptional regulator [Streptomyces sp. JL3001]|uniref:MerR family transcriptional regulator n=1 Tax=Streptomyces sp. JL3001 TaxID=3400923 RepID=UPI003B2857F3
MARQTGLPVKVVRHWSDVGVVTPVGRTVGGYRRYDTAGVARLQLARTLRDLGMGLGEIRAALYCEDGLTEVAAAHVETLEAQVRRLRTHQAVLRTVTRGTTHEGLALMTRTAHMSPDERRNLVHTFLTDTLGDLDVPQFREGFITFNARPFPYGNVWANDAVQAARLGLGDQAYQGMKTMLRKYQTYPNGMTDNTNGVFEYLGVHLAALNESLLQSCNDKIRVFPAAPSDSSFVGRFTLLAKGGFTVSSEREAGEVKYVGIKSLYGNTTRVVNPWGSQQLRVRDVSSGATVLTTSAAEFDLPTSAGKVYVVERTAKPLSTYTPVRLTGSANEGEKTLGGTTFTLGMARTPNPMVNNTQLTYDSNWHATSGRGYGDYNDDTHHSTTLNAVAQYTFTGTGVAYLSERNGDMGTVAVYLDNVFQATVDLRVSGARQVQQSVWQRTGLPQGTHTIRIVNRSTSVGMVDALRITP